MENLAAIVRTHAEEFATLEKMKCQLVSDSNPYATQIEEKWALTRYISNIGAHVSMAWVMPKIFVE